MKSASNLSNRHYLILITAWVLITILSPNGTARAADHSCNNPMESSMAVNFDSVRQVRAGVLDIGYVEAGPSGGQPVILLHGWPYDIRSYSQVTALLAARGYHVFIPYLRGYGTTRFLSPQTVRNGQQAVFATDIIAFMDALKINAAIIGGFDWGARTAGIIAALWPERCRALVSVSGYLIGSQQANSAPLSPRAELDW